jgi:hypothetical protein
MADVAITPANVAPTSNTITDAGTSGAAVGAGDWIYSDSADSNLLKGAAAVGLGIAGAQVVGQALDSAPGRGQPIRYAKLGDVTVGGTLVPGKVYVLSANVGKMCPSADLDAAVTLTDYGTILGVAISTTVLRLGITISGQLRV